MKIVSICTGFRAKFREILTDVGGEIQQHKQDPVGIWPAVRSALTSCIEGGIFFGFTALFVLGVMPFRAIMVFDVPALTFVIGFFTAIVNFAFLYWFWNSLKDELLLGGLAAHYAFFVTSVAASVIFLVLFWILAPNFADRIVRIGTWGSLVLALMAALWTQKCIYCAGRRIFLIESLYAEKATEQLIKKLDLRSCQGPQPAISDRTSRDQDDN